MPRSRRRETGVEAFIAENNDDIEIEDDEEISDEEMEKLMATNKETAKAKSRRAAAAEAEAEEDDDDEEETDDEVENDEEDDDDEDDEDEETEPSGFTPWIYHEEADWELKTAFENVDSGDDVIIYDVDNNRWYKLMPIAVGELTTATEDAEQS